MKFTLVRPEGFDWEAFYIDGKLIEESHSLSAWHILKCLEKYCGCEFEQIEISNEVAEMGMPALLSELEV
jgi:hypothetical protein